MRVICCIVFLVAVAVPVSAIAQTGATTLQPIVTHDNLRSAGRLEDGVLSASLWAGLGEWYPEGEGSRPRLVEALGEEEGPLSIPSPLIRAPAGTTVHIFIRNTLTSPLLIHGLCDKPGACEPVTIPPGTTHEARFALKAAGAFHYWATTTGRPLQLRDGSDSQLGGAIISDSTGALSIDWLAYLAANPSALGAPFSSGVTVDAQCWYRDPPAAKTTNLSNALEFVTTP
jgi:hypothetical protein